MSGCANQASQTIKSIPSDVPKLSSQDVISVAQQHSVNSPLNYYENRAARSVRRGETNEWAASYLGNGKWQVELNTTYNNSPVTYRWTVLEDQQAALFLGAF
jgi:hypothetical protein